MSCGRQAGINLECAYRKGKEPTRVAKSTKRLGSYSTREEGQKKQRQPKHTRLFTETEPDNGKKLAYGPG